MDLRVLRYFLVVAREENITRAAALLHLTQPTLSRQLMQLEAELGVKLFLRSRYRIILTDDGILLRRRAQELVEMADKVEREFRHRGEELAGEVSIGSGELRSMDHLAGLLASFHAMNPQVTYQIYSGNADNIKERIEQGLLDFGLLLEPVDITKYEFIRMPVIEEWGALVSESSPLAALERLTPEELAEQPLILTRRELVQQEFIHWMGPFADRMEVVAGGNLPYNTALLARNNLGAFITLRLLCAYEGLRFLPLSPPLRAGSVLAWKRTQAISPAAQALIQYIQTRLDTVPVEPT